MKKTSRKTLRAMTNRADRKSVSYRLTDDEFRPVDLDLKRENSTGRPEITLAAYAKHALLLHSPLSQTVSRVIELKNDIARGTSDSVPRIFIVEQLADILATRAVR